MFRCHSIIWASLIWALIFSYTLMTHLDVSHIARTSVLTSAAVFIFIGGAILVFEKVAKHTKTILWFASWSISILTGLILFTEEIISDLTLNIWVTTWTTVASLFWCVVSHADKITEPGLHWYIWSLVSIVAVSSAFNNTSSTAITIHIVMCIVLAVVNIGYLIYIYRVQSANNRRCRRLWRVGSCFVVSGGFIIGSILYKAEKLTANAWSEYIMATQGVAFVVVIIDSIVGFSQDEWKAIPDDPPDDIANEI